MPSFVRVVDNEPQQLPSRDSKVIRFLVPSRHPRSQCTTDSVSLQSDVGTPASISVRTGFMLLFDRISCSRKDVIIFVAEQAVLVVVVDDGSKIAERIRKISAGPFDHG